jgi:predicted nucleotidyltransferase
MESIRLREQDIKSMIALFTTLFSKGDRLWLFGSRVDSRKKGGDIDLYVETQIQDIALIAEKKRHFLSDLKLKIGDQKIDVVVNFPGNIALPIYDHAKKHGVLLHENT